MTQLQVAQEQQHPADSMVGERLWNALFTARVDGSRSQVVDLQDAMFRFYLPMARSLAHAVVGESARDRVPAEQAAELGVAQAGLNGRCGPVAGSAGPLGPRSCNSSSSDRAATSVSSRP